MHTGSPEPPPKPVLPTLPSILLTSCSAFWGLKRRQDMEEVSSSSPTASGAGEQAGPKRFLSSRSCKRARRQQRSAGRRSHPTLPASARAEGAPEKLARCGRSHLWPLPTHSLTRTVPIQFLGSGLQLLQLWLGSEASESQSRQDSGSC